MIRGKRAKLWTKRDNLRPSLTSSNIAKDSVRILLVSPSFVLCPSVSLSCFTPPRASSCWFWSESDALIDFDKFRMFHPYPGSGSIDRSLGLVFWEFSVSHGRSPAKKFSDSLLCLIPILFYSSTTNTMIWREVLPNSHLPSFATIKVVKKKYQCLEFPPSAFTIIRMRPSVHNIPWQASHE